MRKILFVFLIMLLFCIPVSAEEDVYTEGYEITKVEEINDALPSEVVEWLANNGIDCSDKDWVNKLSANNVFGYIWDFLKSGMREPISSGFAILCVVLISAAFPSLGAENKPFAPSQYASTLAVAIAVALPIWKAVSVAVSAVKGCGTFMFSFIPIFAGIVTVSGGAMSAVSMSALLLTVSQILVSVCAFAILPLMGSYLAMSLCSSVSPILSTSGITEGIKKISLWVLSLVSTVFLGVLSIQTSVNSAADSVTLRATKFIIGTAVPVAGAALSEATSVLTSSLGLLRTSVGVYGVVALCAIILPIVLSLSIWRIMLLISSVVSQIFAQDSITKILKSVDMMLSLLIGICLFVGAVFIISLTVVVGAVKTI